VIDALRHLYSGIQGLKKIMSRDTYVAAALLGLFDAGQAYITYDHMDAIVSINTDKIDEALQKGFTAEHIMAFAKVVGVHAVALDEDHQIIADCSPEASHRMPPFVFHIRNNHIYPNLNPVVYNSVARRGSNMIHRIKTAAPASIVAAAAKKESKLEINVIPVEDEQMTSKDVWNYILDEASKRGNLPGVTLMRVTR
jgi:hypothetical protein